MIDNIVIISDYKLFISLSFLPNITLQVVGVQSASISTDNGVLCISCTFMIGSDNGGCFVEMKMMSGAGYTALHIGHTKRENIVTGCITSQETAIYNRTGIIS